MIRYLVMFIVFGLAYTGYPSYSTAQEWDSSDASIASVPTTEMGQGSFIPPAALPNHSGQPFGGPVIVLPAPLQAGGVSGFNGIYGFQYPGSYMPRDTPLHRFNGYIVCNPPNPASGATVQRMVKITTTRSLSAPASLQPCPIYTINGEIPKNSSYATTKTQR